MMIERQRLYKGSMLKKRKLHIKGPKKKGKNFLFFGKGAGCVSMRVQLVNDVN